MENLGALSLILAFFLAVYAVIGSAVGQWQGKPFLVLSAQRSVYAVWGLTTLAAGVLVHAFLISDFRLAYVVSHSNLSMPQIYKFTAWWGGMEGSLLLWAWILATYPTMCNVQPHCGVARIFFARPWVQSLNPSSRCLPRW